MDSYTELKELAACVGCAQDAENAEKQAKRLLDQNHAKIVIAGGRGSGKTRLINRMVGFEVWEEGRMRDEEKPLRVAFEQLEDDTRFNCLIAANKQWHNEAAILYELEDEALLCEGRHSAYLDDMDVIIYLVSARAPFNSNQLNTLRALNPLKRFVVLTDLDTVEAKEQDQVLAYANRFADALNIPPVIVWREDANQDLGREIRNALPAYDELQQLRKLHIEYNKRNLIAAIYATAKVLLEENSNSWTETASMHAQASEAANRDSYEWINLRNELRDMQFHANDTVTASLDRECERIIREIIQDGRDQHCSAEWKKKAPAWLDEKLSRLIEKYASNALKTYTDDIDTLSQSARLLGLSGYSEDDFNCLRNTAAEGLSPEKVGHISQADMLANSTFPPPVASVPTDKNKVLIGTGVAVGFFALAPLSLSLSLLGMVGSAGVGAAYYKKISDDEIYAGLKAGMEQFQKVFHRKLNDALNEVYEEAKQILGNKAQSYQSTKNATDVTPFEKQAKILNEVISRCEELLN